MDHTATFVVFSVAVIGGLAAFAGVVAMAIVACYRWTSARR